MRRSPLALLDSGPAAGEDPVREACRETFAASLTAYVKAMDALRAAGATRELPGEEVGRIYALRFGFEQLGDDLADLSARAGELVPGGGAA